ncbi:MAG: NADH-ubiquinone oxidoreductase-F iron-sulfur binding region domain-containing protein [Deltaproteobacteria bacterium]|nr:NADH-ubiquinone oxidoreductase-F iron-sulfur binding region domain-containing protein [Deltaproteobacteria bacterium]
MRFATVRDLETRSERMAAADAHVRRRVLVCSGTGCAAGGALDLYEKLVAQCRKVKLEVEVELAPCGEAKEPLYAAVTGCQGLCQMGPLVQILPDDILYTHVTPDKAKDVVAKTLVGGEVIEKLLYKDPESGKRISKRDEIPFYKGQRFIALEGCGRVQATSLDAYIARGGFSSLIKALGMKPEAVISEVEKSGLRGRGGGGFPTGRKWRSCVEAEGEERFVICNGDEGDPGAFMDCCIMEGDPFRVLEGMMIAAHAVGAKRGFIYVRHEYPRAVERLQKAIADCRETGLLGERILGSGLSFDVRLSRGGGAFVCGESTALMRSIEGNVGEPRAKYVRSVQKGLYDKPTVLNNVETFACVPAVIREGGEWLAKIGTKRSPGTKAFCLVGKVRNTGLIEVPMGTTLRSVIYGIGGGIIDGRPFKAVQTGGPSGGCLPESALDLPVDFDALIGAGSMMGSGGMIIMDDRTCMVDVAKYFLHFLLEESCGKCVPCREGIFQLHAMLEAMSTGRSQAGDLEKVRRLAEDIAASSLCGLGKSAPNPVLSTLRYFEAEYRAHIENHKCPAGVCRELTTFQIDKDKCTGCMVCVKACPPEAITGEKKKPHAIDEAKCTRCGACRTVCGYDAVQTR